MNQSVQISVIVPVYNTAEYLAACIASIVSQTYSNLQIILIDDGSSDGSGALCDHWAQRDERIQVIHQPNAGVSAARNAGLEIAEGELIAFVDSDDILPAQAYSRLLSSLRGTDLVMGGMQLMEENGAMMSEKQIPRSAIGYREFLEELFREREGCYLGYLCDKLLKTELIRRNGIRFNPRIKLNEDRLFLLEYLLHCDTIAICEAVVYHYRQRSGGVITATRRNKTVTDSEMTVMDSFRKMRDLAVKHSETLSYIVSRKAFESALDLYSRVSEGDRQKKKQICQFMGESARQCLGDSHAGFGEKLKILGHWMLKR